MKPTLTLSAVSEAMSANPQMEITVNGNAITGFVASGDGPLTVTGTIETDGSITGGFAFVSGAAYAIYSGNVAGSILSGTWEDQFGCNGTWSASKS